MGEKTLLAEELFRFVERLGHAVGEKEQRVAGRQVQRLARDLVAAHESGDSARGWKLTSGGVTRREHHGWVVTGACHGDASATEVEHRALQGDEHAPRVLFGELVVEGAE